MISVRASLLGAMLTLVFLIALALLITMQINAARLVRDLSETIFGARAAQVQAQLSAYFEPVVVALEAMGSTIRNGRLDPLEPGEMTRYSAGLVAVADQICAVSACDTAGNMYSLEYRDGLWVTRYQAPSSWPGKVRLERFSDPSQPAVARWWEQAAGDPRASHWYQGAENIAILAARGAVQRAPAAIGAAVHWTETYRFAGGREPGITASMLVTAPSGKQVVIAADLSIAQLDEYSDSLRPTPHGYVLLTDKRGNLLEPEASSDDAPPADRAGGSRKDPAARVSIEEDHTPMRDALAAWSRRHGHEWSPEESARIALKASSGLSDAEDVFPFASRGGAWWGDIRPVFMGDEPTFFIAVLIPQSDLAGSVQRERLTLLLVTLAAILLAVGLALSISKALSSPIAALARQSERIRQLQLDGGFEESERSHLLEVAQLSKAQASMRSALDSFARYIPTELVRDLLARGEAARIGGKLLPLTVLTTDIRGFTALCERQAPELLIFQLAEYFERLLSVLREHGATVDKIVGDSVVAFWGAPGPVADGEGRAVAAALAITREVHALNEQWRMEGKPVLVTHVAVTSGEAIVGNIGARWRLNYTAIGDAVNLASRLEKLNPVYGTEILVAGSVREKAGEDYAWRVLDRVAVRGRSAPVEISAPLGLAGEADPAELEKARRYEAMLALIWEQRFEAALAAALELRRSYPPDSAVEYQIERLHGFLKHPPHKYWNGESYD